MSSRAGPALLSKRDLELQSPFFRADEAGRRIEIRAWYSQGRSSASSVVNYGVRYRKGQRIATTMGEASVNHMVATRMVKKQQMRWSRRGAHLMLQVRAAVANDDLERQLAYRRPSPGISPRFRIAFGAEPPLLAAA